MDGKSVLRHVVNLFAAAPNPRKMKELDPVGIGQSPFGHMNQMLHLEVKL